MRCSIRVQFVALALILVRPMPALLAQAPATPVAANVAATAGNAAAFTLPDHEPVKFELRGKLGPGPGQENSGIVKSRIHPDTYWVINDSGDEPRVYAIKGDGSDARPARAERAPGVLIGGAINVDWEDIAVDDRGHVIVADVGNNGNNRRDLVLYYLIEPAPTAERTTVFKKLFVHYPDQTQFPSPADNFNFDCEAVFTVDNVVHFISKNRTGTQAKLYRLDNPQPDASNALSLIETFDFRAKVVGADASADGLQLIVTTYEALWLFERESKADPFFHGKVSWAPFKSDQVEAVCFGDNHELMLTDEKKSELYSLPLSALHLVREALTVREKSAGTEKPEVTSGS